MAPQEQAPEVTEPPLQEQAPEPTPHEESAAEVEVANPGEQVDTEGPAEA